MWAIVKLHDGVQHRLYGELGGVVFLSHTLVSIGTRCNMIVYYILLWKCQIFM